MRMKKRGKTQIKRIDRKMISQEGKQLGGVLITMPSPDFMCATSSG